MKTEFSGNGMNRKIFFSFMCLIALFGKYSTVPRRACKANNGLCSRQCPANTCEVGRCCRGVRCKSRRKCCVKSQLIYSEKNRIIHLDVDTGINTTIADITSISNSGIITAVDYHLTNGFIYFTSYKPGGLWRISFPNPSNKKMEKLVSSGITKPLSVAVDSINNHIYWTDSDRKELNRCDIDGSNIVTLINEWLDRPRGIELHVEKRHIYLTDWGSYPRVERCDYDGNNRTMIIPEDTRWPNGLALDLSTERVYWVDAYKKKIKSAKLDGTDVQVIYEDRLAADFYPFDITLDCNYLYYTDTKKNPYKLLKLSKIPGSKPIPISAPSKTPHYGIELYRPDIRSKIKPSYYYRHRYY